MKYFIITIRYTECFGENVSLASSQVPCCSESTPGRAEVEKIFTNRLKDCTRTLSDFSVEELSESAFRTAYPTLIRGMMQTNAVPSGTPVYW